MSKQRHGWNQKPRPPQHPSSKKQTYNIDRFTVEDIRQGKERQEAFSHYYWGQYSEFAYQRSLIMDEIKKALVAAAIKPFHFSGFQRAVTYKRSLDPLSVEGSVKSTGGRFNIGDIDRTKFPAFPALYLGEDKDTALQEIFQCNLSGINGLSPQELALTNIQSISIVSVFGALESIIDLYQPERLQTFVDLIKNFKYSEALKREATGLGVNDSKVENVAHLLSAIYDHNWRGLPMHMDVPSSPQIFGQIVLEAGIEGIRYKSKYTEKPCLAIYPQNFLGPDSFVELKDQCPPEVKRKRVDVNHPIEVKES